MKFLYLQIGIDSELLCRENIIVSLVHDNNISYRNTPKVKPNGSHFNLSEKIFRFITSFNNEKKNEKQNNQNNEKQN